MKVVVDRLVQHPNRYTLTNVDTGVVLGTFDFVESTGTVQQIGTEINKELFDSIADDLAKRVITDGGNASALVVDFPEITTVENITTGDTIKNTFSKIANWFKNRIAKLKKYTYDSSTLIAKNDIADGVIPPVVQATGTSAANVMSQNATTSAVNTALASAKTYAETTVQGTITQQTGSGTDVVMSQNAVTVELNKKVDKVSGKQLSTNDYTTAEKNKLAGITEGANKYVLPIATADVLGGIKSGNDISISTTGLVTVLDNSHNHTIANVTGLQTILDAKYVKPSTGIPLTDLESGVQTSLGKADTALQTLPATVVYTDTTQTITGSKTFTGTHNFTGETKFTNSQYTPTFTDIANGIGKSSGFTRGALMQTITGQVIAPNTAVSDATRGYNTEKNKIKFQYIISTDAGQPTLGELAVLSTTGMTIGTKTVATTDQIPSTYAGSSSAGGSANSAVKLDTSAGSSTQPVYFSGGKPVATTYTLGASVPSGAKFTDTTYTVATQSANGLMSASDKKKLDSNVVTLDGPQTITGVKTFNAPSNVASTEQVTAWFYTANGGRVGFGKEKNNSGTGIFFDQVSGTRRLNFRASTVEGAMVWEQPEKGAQLYVDLGARGSDFHRVSFPSSGGTLALTTDFDDRYVPKTGGTFTGAVTVSNEFTLQTGSVSLNIAGATISLKTPAYTHNFSFPSSQGTLATISDIPQYYNHDIYIRVLDTVGNQRIHFSFICTKSTACTWEEIYQYAPTYNIATGLLSTGSFYQVVGFSFNGSYDNIIVHTIYNSEIQTTSFKALNVEYTVFTDTVKKIS